MIDLTAQSLCGHYFYWISSNQEDGPCFYIAQISPLVSHPQRKVADLVTKTPRHKWKYGHWVFPCTKHFTGNSVWHLWKWKNMILSANEQTRCFFQSHGYTDTMYTFKTPTGDVRNKLKSSVPGGWEREKKAIETCRTKPSFMVQLIVEAIPLWSSFWVKALQLKSKQILL